MPFGILESRTLETVPGTAIISDQEELPPEFANIPRHLLKHGKGRYKDIILVPQPTSSPNDPLNWPQWKKEMILAILGLVSAVVGAYGPMLSPGFVEIAGNLGISVQTLSESTAWLILCLGLSLFITNPLAKIYGRRPVLLVSLVIMFATSVWGAAVTEYDSFLASRIVAGIGMAPYEVLIFCTIGDMYFVHERATRIAVWNLFLLTGIAGGALVAGYIIELDGYRWTFGVCAIFFGILLIAVVFLVPETAYRRDEITVVSVPDTAADGEAKTGAADVPVHLELGHEHGHRGLDDKELRAMDPTSADYVAAAEKKQGYWKSLSVYNGRFTSAPIWKIFARPFVIFFYPAVILAFLVFGTTLTWIVVFSVVNAVIFTAPPYNFTVSQTGLISLSPFILTILGEVIVGPWNDYICLWLARKNRGIYEPEFRLPLMIIAALLGTVGFFGFGATVHYQTHWSGPVLCFGLANMSLAFLSTCVFGYVIDSYRSHVEEALIAINARNILTFGLTYFVNDWLAKQGPLVVFSILGSLFLFVCSLTIPMWIFGKKLRALIARNEWLHKFMNDDD